MVHMQSPFITKSVYAKFLALPDEHSSFAGDEQYLIIVYDCFILMLYIEPIVHYHC